MASRNIRPIARTRVPNPFLTALGAATLTLAIFAATLAWPQSASQQAVPPSPGEEGPLVAEGNPADLAILYTGGVVGYVEPCG